jgi:hypothetical protein
MQPPPDRTNKNPYAMPSAWPRAPQQTFHLQVPRPPARSTQAAQPTAPVRPAPRPAKAPASSILTGSALPPGYTAPQPIPEDIAPAFEPVEAVPDVTPAPPFVAPPETPFAAPLPAAKSRRESRMPLFIAAAVAAIAGIAATAWLLMREPESVTSTIVEPAAMPAPARAPVIVPPSLDYIMTEEEAFGEPALRGTTETSEPAPVTRVAPSQAAVAMPSGPVPYSGTATAVTPPPAPPVMVQPRPVPPPPASAPGPTPPVADPDAPQTTRDPTSGT